MLSRLAPHTSSPPCIVATTVNEWTTNKRIGPLAQEEQAKRRERQEGAGATPCYFLVAPRSFLRTPRLTPHALRLVATIQRYQIFASLPLCAFALKQAAMPGAPCRSHGRRRAPEGRAPRFAAPPAVGHGSGMPAAVPGTPLGRDAVHRTVASHPRPPAPRRDALPIECRHRAPEGRATDHAPPVECRRRALEGRATVSPSTHPHLTLAPRASAPHASAHPRLTPPPRGARGARSW